MERSGERETETEEIDEVTERQRQREKGKDRDEEIDRDEDREMRWGQIRETEPASQGWGSCRGNQGAPRSPTGDPRPRWG